MKCKSRIAVCGVLAAAAVSCAAFAVSPPNAVPYDAQPLAVAASAVGQPAAASGFIVREHEGYIAVFTAGEEALPAVITDIEVKGLPEADRSLLKSGIEIGGNEELMSLLEDYGS